MPGVFSKKYFNEEVFRRYMDRVPNLRLNRLLSSGAIRQRPELASAMRDQTGGNYISTPLRGLIDGDPVNYDGATNITASDTTTYMHSRIVVGRAKAWKELDFSTDITGGQDFMANIASQLTQYWATVDQNTLSAILTGIFAMTGTGNQDFVNRHTYDVQGVTNANGVTGYIDATTINSAVQQASGDNKGIFRLIITHSAVATNLENANILKRVTIVENGVTREANLGTVSGKLLLIDDSMPAVRAEVTAGVYTVTIGGTVANGDKITVGGVTITLDATGGASASAAATALKTALDADTDFTAVYSTSRSEAVITCTERSGHYGAGKPGASITSTAGTIAVAQTTAPVVNTAYTTYVLGTGAIEYTNVGAKVPYEVDRNPATNGGEDLLYTRQRKCWAPYGISFTKTVMSTASPTLAELQNGANWELVHSPTGDGEQWINHRAISIARILSLG